MCETRDAHHIWLRTPVTVCSACSPQGVRGEWPRVLIFHIQVRMPLGGAISVWEKLDSTVNELKYRVACMVFNPKLWDEDNYKRPALMSNNEELGPLTADATWEQMGFVFSHDVVLEFRLCWKDLELMVHDLALIPN